MIFKQSLSGLTTLTGLNTTPWNKRMMEIYSRLSQEFKEFLKPENAKKLYEEIVSFKINKDRSAQDIKYKTTDFDNLEVLYAFWVKKSAFEGMCNVNVEYQGSKSTKRNDNNLKYNIFNATWNLNNSEDWIMLYGGKTTNLDRRIREHLMLGTPVYLLDENYNRNNLFLYKRNSMSKFRAGLSHVLKYGNFWKGSELEFIKEHVYFNHMPNKCFQERFYLEDLLIGIGKPWFNLDSER